MNLNRFVSIANSTVERHKARTILHLLLQTLKLRLQRLERKYLRRGQYRFDHPRELTCMRTDVDHGFDIKGRNVRVFTERVAGVVAHQIETEEVQRPLHDCSQKLPHDLSAPGPFQK